MKIKDLNISGFRNRQSQHYEIGSVLDKNKRLNNSSTGF
jgi:hypothetical protein